MPRARATAEVNAGEAGALALLHLAQQRQRHMGLLGELPLGQPKNYALLSRPGTDANSDSVADHDDSPP